MAIWPFNRRKKTGGNLPTEVQDYYQAEQRDRTGVAWLLALGTLVATILLALGLFFGGRWVYRQVADSETDRTARNGQETQSPEDARGEATQPESGATPPPTPNTQASPTPSSTTLPTPQSITSAQETGTEANLPSTGPTEDISVFLIATAIGTILYQIRLRRRTTSN